MSWLQKQVRLLDFNPFGKVTDSLLFSWDELEEYSEIQDGVSFSFILYTNHIGTRWQHYITLSRFQYRVKIWKHFFKKIVKDTIVWLFLIQCLQVLECIIFSSYILSSSFDEFVWFWIKQIALLLIIKYF